MPTTTVNPASAPRRPPSPWPLQRSRSQHGGDPTTDANPTDDRDDREETTGDRRTDRPTDGERDGAPALEGGSNDGPDDGTDGDGSPGDAGTPAATAARGSSDGPAGESTDDRQSDRETDASATGVLRYAYWGAFAVISVIALVALFRFYLQASSAIDLWIEPEYEPIMQAAFNLVVLLLSVPGISSVVRKLA